MAVSLSFCFVVRVKGGTFSDLFGWLRSRLLRQITKINQSQSNVSVKVLLFLHINQGVTCDLQYPEVVSGTCPNQHNNNYANIVRSILIVSSWVKFENIRSKNHAQETFTN